MIPDPRAEEALESIGEWEALHRAVDGLPEHQRTVIRRRYWLEQKVDHKIHAAALRALRELAFTHAWGGLFCGGEYLDIYQEDSFCEIFPPSEYKINLSHKRNGYGGRQTFFLCPGCGGRVRFLYLTGRLFWVYAALFFSHAVRPPFLFPSLAVQEASESIGHIFD